MERNKLLYFIVGAALTAFGYVIRVMQVENYHRSSTILIAMGLFFIFAIMFKKANEGILLTIELLVCFGIHIIRLTNIPWYNAMYDSDLGKIVMGGPILQNGSFQYIILVYILCGVVLGLFFEMIIRQYNKIGLGD